MLRLQIKCKEGKKHLSKSGIISVVDITGCFVLRAEYLLIVLVGCQEAGQVAGEPV